jgi:hypothetical protein
LPTPTGTWTYTPALNDDTNVSFSYTVTDGDKTAAGSASLDITPVNDAPTTSPVTLTAIAEDSGARVITKAELLANAADVDTDLSALNVTGVAIVAGGKGGLVDNGNGTWTYTPALNDDTNVSFSYTVTDGDKTAAGSASLDITPVNDAPTTSPVTLTAIAEDSGARVITKAELLANAADVDTDLSALNVTGVAIVAGGKGGPGRQRQRDLDLHPGSERRHERLVLLHGHGRGQDGSRFGFARHHPGQRRADDLAGDADGDCRGQRRSCDHEGRASRQCR